MKIYILPITDKFQPSKQPFLYPKYNDDYGVEQDFLKYLYKNPQLLTDNQNTADWHYLPVYWTRYHLNRNYDLQRLEQLQHEVDRVILNEKRTFTVCQFDDGPIVNIGYSLQCLASKKNASVPGINIPLLASPIPSHVTKATQIKWLASFQGQFKNHTIRSQLGEILKGRNDIWYSDGDEGLDTFVEKILSAYIGLCPRGYGGSSFRLYEVMQLGRVPLIISDVDIRPFKKAIKWDDFSIYNDDITKINQLLENASRLDLFRMGELAKQVRELLGYGKWCKYLIDELKEI